MASIRTHKRRDGGTSYYVLWREKGTQRSKPFDDKYSAETFKDFLNSNNQSLSSAAKAAKQAKMDGPTVAELLTLHIESRTGIEDRTRADYARLAERHIVPTLGKVRVKALKPAQVRALVNGLHEDGKAPKTIANVHGLLSAALATAREEGIRDDNPSKGVRLPQREDAEDEVAHFLELDEYEGLLSYFAPKWRIVPELLFGTGMRWGEASALKAGDLSTRAAPAFVSVRRAWKRGATATHRLARPKTRRSVRDVTIDDGLAEMLEAQVDLYRMGGEGLVLRGIEGGQLHYSNFQARVWTPAVNKAVKDGVLKEKPTIHWLRHTHASQLLLAGVPLLTVSRRLGHESIQTTANIYGHLTQRGDRASADAVAVLRNRRRDG